MASRLATFLSELRRRKVYHVAAGYLIVGFGVASGAQYILEIMGFGLAPARPVAVLVILGFPIALMLAWAYEVRPEESQTRPEIAKAREEREASLAVLPFVDMSPSGDQQFFCDGMAEELINVLAREEKLLVVSRTSSFVFREGSVDAREVGRKLGVATILEGSVRRAADRIRVTAQLVNTEDGFHLWSDTYDRSLDDVFGVQEEIARSILQALLPKFVSDYSDRISTVITTHTRAYDLFMKGREAHFTYTEEGCKRALDYFSRAIQQSSAWAAPYAAQAEAYAMLLFHGTLSPEYLLPKVRVNAEKAVELDSTAGDGLALLAVEKAIGRHDWVGAETDLLSAISLSPNAHPPRLWYGIFLLPALGRHKEAMEQAAFCVELDPLNPAAVADLLWVSLQARKYDDALGFGERALGMAPGFPFAVSGVAMVHEVLGNLKKAEEAHQAAVAVTQGHPFYRTQLARCHALAGRTIEAREILGNVTGEWEYKYASPYYLATAYQALDEPERASHWLRQAYETKDPWLVFLGEDPIMDPLRADPLLGNLLRRMSLPQADRLEPSSGE
jgi:TolB-like protein/Tfp pilus assembly protein PilF